MKQKDQCYCDGLIGSRIGTLIPTKSNLYTLCLKVHVFSALATKKEFR